MVFSSLGFYFLAKAFKKYDDLNCDPNVWCLCGFIYGILGTWPMAALGFASLPWMLLNIYLLYKTKKYKYIPFLLVFIFSTSFILLSVFALFYYFIFVVVVSIKDKKVCIPLLLGFVLLCVAYFITNSHHCLQGLQGSAGSIKSLKPIVYDETIAESLGHIKQAFFFRKYYYHAGGTSLSYVAIPLCSVYLIYFIYKFFIKKEREKQAILFFIIYAAIIVNVLACCFDKNYLFRKIIPFASGFMFWRFAWLSPFFWVLLLGIVCNNIKEHWNWDILLLSFIFICLDPKYNQRSSMYNELFCNISVFNSTVKLDANHEWTWKEYFAEDLFTDVKETIKYNGEWSIGFGIEPSVLQYNGIKTLDGYFSNYPIEYHDKFQKMIQPQLDDSEYHADYWESSSGMRAYVWSDLWLLSTRRNADYEETELKIDMAIFKELKGKYIFSRVYITNADELGISLIGGNVFSDIETTTYSIYVYKVK